MPLSFARLCTSSVVFLFLLYFYIPHVVFFLLINVFNLSRVDLSVFTDPQKTSTVIAEANGDPIYNKQ